MLKDTERYILTTARASVIRNVLSLVLARLKPEVNANPATNPGLEAVLLDDCKNMILELRRPKESECRVKPAIRNLRISRLGRVLVVTGEATSPEMLREVEELRRPHFYPHHLASSLHAFAHTISCTLHLAPPEN